MKDPNEDKMNILMNKTKQNLKKKIKKDAKKKTESKAKQSWISETKKFRYHKRYLIRSNSLVINLAFLRSNSFPPLFSIASK